MSYDLYCYRSTIGRPDLKEAQERMEEGTSYGQESETVKHAIAKALLDFHPKLKAIPINYAEIARLLNITVEEAKEQHKYIELNPPAGEGVIQITVYDTSVALAVPYWHSEEVAKGLFQTLTGYLKVIGTTAGYFTYDPQTDQVFDPLTTDIQVFDLYLKTANEFQNKATKPWWKIW